MNPFEESLYKTQLYNIATAKPVSYEIAEVLLNDEDNGVALRKIFLNEFAAAGNRLGNQ